MAAIGEASHGELLDVLRVIQQALAVPFAATEGDERIRRGIVDRRTDQVRGMLDALLGEVPEMMTQPREARPAWADSVAWETRYLWERLTDHPATGYRLYRDLAKDPKAFYEGLAADREVIGGGHVDG